jgi:hypothetical protein
MTNWRTDNTHYFQGVVFPAGHSMWGRWAPRLERSKLVATSHVGKFNMRVFVTRSLVLRVCFVVLFVFLEFEQTLGSENIL